MRKSKIIVIALCGMILTSCNGVSDSIVENTEEKITTSDTTSNETTVTTETNINSDTSVNTTSTSATDENVVTSADTTTTNTLTDTNASITLDTSTPLDTTSNNTDTSNTESISTYDNLVIPTTSHSEYIDESICKEIAEYFHSMKNIDVETFQSKQLPEYNSFMNSYLEENSSNIEDMLNTYHKNILKSNNTDTQTEETPYSSVDFNSIELVYPNDFDSIMNTMNYINQLDKITQEYGEYTISKELSAYYELEYKIDYTLHGENVDDYNNISGGKILVLQMNNQNYLIMLS